ncbi:hypothetical protein ACLI4Q_19130 [Natrialbaceae archaeon A-CW1-1]
MDDVDNAVLFKCFWSQGKDTKGFSPRISLVSGALATERSRRTGS